MGSEIDVLLFDFVLGYYWFSEKNVLQIFPLLVGRKFFFYHSIFCCCLTWCFSYYLLICFSYYILSRSTFF